MLVDTRVGRIFIEDQGSGPAVALWPSLFTNGRMWHAQIQALSDTHRVISIDPPGHARSLVPRADYTMDDCVAAAAEVLDAVGERRVAWFGLSWGGMVGMRLALRHPERIVALGLLDTSARKEPAWNRIKYTVLAETLLRPLGPVREMIDRLAVPELLGATTRRTNPTLADQLGDSLSRLERKGALRAMRAVFSRDDVLGELSRIRVPTLVLVGEEDTATLPAESERIHAAILGSKLVKIPGAGHLAAIEAPDAVTHAMLDLLAAARW
ncbi:MAG: alpha/beta fold hydrolase [Deltaproteobacteria bacterium]|nr:alpha/beta fold hydrolase [Deltaproteobacteria bacterium]